MSAAKKPTKEPPATLRAVAECRGTFFTLTNGGNCIPDRPYRIRISQYRGSDILIDMTPAAFNDLRVQMGNLQQAVYKRDNP